MHPILTRKLAIGVCFSAMLLSGTAQAQVFNGGIPSGYSCTGNCGTSSAAGVVTLSPLGGSRFGYVSTTDGVVANPLGIDGTTDGSILRSTTFSSTAGQALSFSFNYITTDGTLTFTDYAYVRLIDVLAGATPITLFTARTRPVGLGNTVPGFGLPGLAPGVTLTPSTTPIIPGGPTFPALGTDSGLCFQGNTNGCGYTGWINASYIVGATSNYQIEFGVFNFGDRNFDSALAFDFASGVGGTPIVPGITAVPEPTTVTLCCLGLAGIAVAARRRRRSR